MNEVKLKQIIADAIAGLPDKGYITELVENLEKKINENIRTEIDKVVKPLCNKIEILERKMAVYDAHFSGLEKRLRESEIKIDDAEQYSRRACLRIYGVKDLEKVDFVYADVNCRIGMKTKEGNFFFFNSTDELDELISENEIV